MNSRRKVAALAAGILMTATGLAVAAPGVAAAGPCPSATALSVINQGRTSFWNYHESGVADNATALKNINQAASGLAAVRSDYGTAPGGSVCLSTSMLNGLYYVGSAYRLTLSEIAGRSHSAGSQHYQGVMQSCRNNGASLVL